MSFKAIDTTLIHQQLLPRFLNYEIYSLGVDTSGNVLVRTEVADAPTLIRFSDLGHKPSEYEKWKHLKGNWYQKD